MAGGQAAAGVVAVSDRTYLPVRWVKLMKYCELTGDTPDAVHSKRRKGQFVDGVHCRLAPDGNIWVNLEAVDAWVLGKPASSIARAE